MSKYFIYCRKSTDSEDRQVLSIEAQLHELREYAKHENLEIIEEFTESKTAKAPGREIFNEMISRIESGEADGIIAWNPDRLARNSIDGGKIIYLTDTKVIRSLKFPTFWFEDSPQGKFNLSIAFGQSKFMIDNLSQNVKRGIRQKLRRGEYPGPAPLGYINNFRTRTIEPHPEQFEKVKKLLEMYATGDYSFTDIQNEAFKMGVQTKYKTKIALETIRRTLKKPFYYGIFKYSGEMHKGTYEPMISKETYDKIQEVMNRKARAEYIPNEKFELKGIARCAECGSPITAEEHTKKKSGKKYRYYRCTNVLKENTDVIKTMYAKKI